MAVACSQAGPETLCLPRERERNGEGRFSRRGRTTAAVLFVRRRKAATWANTVARIGFYVCAVCLYVWWRQPPGSTQGGGGPLAASAKLPILPTSISVANEREVEERVVVVVVAAGGACAKSPDRLFVSVIAVEVAVEGGCLSRSRRRISLLSFPSAATCFLFASFSRYSLLPVALPHHRRYCRHRIAKNSQVPISTHIDLSNTY